MCICGLCMSIVLCVVCVKVPGLIPGDDNFGVVALHTQVTLQGNRETRHLATGTPEAH